MWLKVLAIYHPLCACVCVSVCLSVCLLIRILLVGVTAAANECGCGFVFQYMLCVSQEPIFKWLSSGGTFPVLVSSTETNSNVRPCNPVEICCSLGACPSDVQRLFDAKLDYQGRSGLSC